MKTRIWGPLVAATALTLSGSAAHAQGFGFAPNTGAGAGAGTFNPAPQQNFNGFNPALGGGFSNAAAPLPFPNRANTGQFVAPRGVNPFAVGGVVPGRSINPFAVGLGANRFTFNGMDARPNNGSRLNPVFGAGRVPPTAVTGARDLQTFPFAGGGFVGNGFVGNGFVGNGFVGAPFVGGYVNTGNAGFDPNTGAAVMAAPQVRGTANVARRSTASPVLITTTADPEQRQLKRQMVELTSDRPLISGQVTGVGPAGIDVTFVLDDVERTRRFDTDEVFFFDRGSQLQTAASAPGSLVAGTRVMVASPEATDTARSRRGTTARARR